MLRSFAEYLGQSRGATSEGAPPTLAAIHGDLDRIKASLDAEIDRLVGELRTLIMDPNLGTNRTFFDRIKNWWSNLFGRRESPQNPYYWQNKIGELGRYESVGEYRAVSELTTLLEADLGSGRITRIEKILQGWAAKAKQVLTKYIDDIRAAADRVAGHTIPTDEPPAVNTPPGDTPPTATPPSADTPPGTGPLPDRDDDEKLRADPGEAGPLPGATGTGRTLFDSPDEEGSEATGAPLLPPQTDDEIRSPAQVANVRAILKKIGKSPNHALTPEESKIVSVVWQPWNDLPRGQKQHLNKRGNNGQQRLTKNRGQLPVVLPWVLRKGDPRIDIIKTYYPDVYKTLEDAGRIEAETDTEDSVNQRIDQFLKRAEGKKNKSADFPLLDVPNGPPEPDMRHNPTLDALLGDEEMKMGPDKEKGRKLAARIEALREKFPEDVIDALYGELTRGDYDNAERFLQVLEAEDGEGDYSARFGDLDKEHAEVQGIVFAEVGRSVMRNRLKALPLDERHKYLASLLSSR